MADWSQPTLTTAYATFLSDIQALTVDSITQMQGGAGTNLPNNAMRWNPATYRWETFNSGSGTWSAWTTQLSVGTVTLGGDPTQALQAATKQYVDGSNGGKLSTSGGSVTGAVAFQTGCNFTGQQQFSYGNFTDPQVGTSRDAKFGGNGIAVRGGIYADNVVVTASATGPTPGQGDNSGSFATTGFVRQAGFAQRGTYFTSSTTLSANQSGTLVYCSGSGITMTLPAIATALNFGIYVSGSSAGAATVTPSAGVIINAPSPLIVAPGQWIVLACDGANWQVTGAHPGIYAAAVTNAINTFTKAQIGQVLTIGPTSGNITLDFSQSNNFIVALNGNATLENPSNMAIGQSGVIGIFQDTRCSMAFGSDWRFGSAGVPSLTTTVGWDVMSYYVFTGGLVLGSLIGSVA